MTAQIIYKGDLRCECTHLQSGTIIETDAPTDNRGKGERFSPTDTVCVALATCIITTMGIVCIKNACNVPLGMPCLEMLPDGLWVPNKFGYYVKIGMKAFGYRAGFPNTLEQ